MHWIILALLYVVVGGVIGSAYAWLTGASDPTRAEVVAWAATFGPAILMVMAGVRKVMREDGTPFARWTYHTLLVTFAAPMFCFGTSLLLNALGCLWFARLFKGLSYWSIPIVFVAAASHGLWRATREFNRRFERSSTGGPTPPVGSGGNRPAAASHRDPAEESPLGDGQAYRVVACFSGRGTPFRLVRRPV